MSQISIPKWKLELEDAYLGTMEQLGEFACYNAAISIMADELCLDINHIDQVLRDLGYGD